jgi:hypothetical protein
MGMSKVRMWYTKFRSDSFCWLDLTRSDRARYQAEKCDFFTTDSAYNYNANDLLSFELNVSLRTRVVKCFLIIILLNVFRI